MGRDYREPDDIYADMPEGRLPRCGDIRISGFTNPFRRKLQRALHVRYGHMDLFIDGSHVLSTSIEGTKVIPAGAGLEDRPNARLLSPKNGLYPDEARILEFSEAVQRDGNDEWNWFSLLGINFSVKPTVPEEITGPYTCVTLCGAALYYGGLDVRALTRSFATPGKAVGAGIWKL
jgi:hypothetical protein